MDANSTVIQDLDTSTEYIVQVSATNGAGILFSPMQQGSHCLSKV